MIQAVAQSHVAADYVSACAAAAVAAVVEAAAVGEAATHDADWVAAETGDLEKAVVLAAYVNVAALDMHDPAAGLDLEQAVAAGTLEILLLGKAQTCLAPVLSTLEVFEHDQSYHLSELCETAAS